MEYSGKQGMTYSCQAGIFENLVGINMIYAHSYEDWAIGHRRFSPMCYLLNVISDA